MVSHPPADDENPRDIHVKSSSLALSRKKYDSSSQKAKNTFFPPFLLFLVLFFSLQSEMIQDLWWPLSLPQLPSHTPTEYSPHTREGLCESICPQSPPSVIHSLHICTQIHKCALCHMRHPLFLGLLCLRAHCIIYLPVLGGKLWDLEPHSQFLNPPTPNLHSLVRHKKQSLKRIQFKGSLIRSHVWKGNYTDVRMEKYM